MMTTMAAAGVVGVLAGMAKAEAAPVEMAKAEVSAAAGEAGDPDACSITVNSGS
ncbi:hypothetical protein [uncultured Roseibium sp.]|uniref:hypothetical protein n=1 Tax=uncultured Roseibium sp. TaxID=1936171 RepID=UPI0032167D19